MGDKRVWRTLLNRTGLGQLAGDVAREIRVSPKERTPNPSPRLPSQREDAELLALAQGDQYRTRRVWVIMLVFALLASAIMARLVLYQLAEPVAAGAAPVARNPASRGVVLDRRGNLFAQDRFEYEIRLAPDQIKTNDDRAVVASGLETILGIDAGTVKQQLDAEPDRKYLMVAKGVPFEDGQRILQLIEDQTEDYPALRNIEVAPIPIRFYPQKALAAHMMGFVGLASSRQAHYGIEEYYSEFLRDDGQATFTQAEIEPATILSPDVQRFVPSPAGRDIILTLDRGIQWIIEDELYQGLQLYRAERGTIIVMEPNSGAILGMANWPTYDPNNYPVSDPKVFQNPAISAQWEPGSIFKVVTMAAALDAEIIEPETTFIDSGAITIGERTLLNSSRTGAGEVTAAEALALSINVVTAEMAEQLGPEQFYRYVRRFGFGQATEIDLADEIPGAVKRPGSADWSLSDLGTNSFGQGIAATPIQMVNAVAAIANGGSLMRPYVIQSRIYDGQVQHAEPTVANQVITPESSKKITEMMVGVVNYGATAARVPGYTVAGKTGTAEIPGEGGYLEDATIVSFVGFGPVEDPQFVILIKLDRPDSNISQWATATAAPIFSRVAQRLFDYLNVPPN